MTAILVAVVQAQVVAALQTVAAVAAAAMRNRADAIARLPSETLRARAALDNHGGPFVAGDERKRRRPEARIIAVDDVRIRPADERRVHLAHHIVRFQRTRNRHIFDGELTRRVQHDGAHDFWKLRHSSEAFRLKFSA